MGHITTAFHRIGLGIVQRLAYQVSASSMLDLGWNGASRGTRKVRAVIDYSIASRQ